MSFKCIHLSDIHFRGLQRHDEYKEVFSNFFIKAKDLSPDAIFVGGDIVHSKTQGISPELIDLLTWWFTSLTEIAPVHMILGNHDGLILNESRQDAISPILSALKNDKIKLHLVGKLQTNKVKFALKIFDYIHSLDSEKLANKISDEQIKQGKKPKIFIQVNIGNEDQKSGINKEKIDEFNKFCKNLNLDIIGTMCIPPNDEEASLHFALLRQIADRNNLKELSMGMSADYSIAINFGATYVRIGSGIFGPRSDYHIT